MAAIAFTYEAATLVGQARLLAGDTDGAGLNRAGGDRTRTDAEIETLLTQNGNDVRATAAALLEGKAAEYAQAATRTTQGALQQDWTQRSQQCLAVAEALRRQASGAVKYVAGEKVFSTGSAGGTMDGW